MEINKEKLKPLTKNLNTGEPRSSDETLAGQPFAARCLDKCRATLLGVEGEFRYGCAMDQKFFSAIGTSAAAFKEFVATGASDHQVEQWIQERTKA